MPLMNTTLKTPIALVFTLSLTALVGCGGGGNTSSGGGGTPPLTIIPVTANDATQNTARLADMNADIVSADKMTPAGLKNYLESEIAKWAPVIKKAGIYAD